MAASKANEALQALAEHFASNEANYRERELGARLFELLGVEPPAPEPEPETADETDETE